jgi:WD40 repeat protein
VSYSRDDRDIVARIVGALEAAGENVWVDLEDIAPSAIWMDEIKTAIAGSDSMVFFLSPDSAASAVCRAELDHAVQLSKRVVPVLIRDVADVTVPAPLPDINWHAIESETFDADVARLVEVLNTDIARVHQHTRLLVRATEWESRDGDASLLLHGSQLAEAEKWLEGQTDQKPTTTPVQARFIAASRRAATGRQRRWYIVTVAIATVFAVIATVAVVEWRSAVHQRQIATEQRNVAVAALLADEARNTLASDPQLALILALRAYDTSPTTVPQDVVRGAVRLAAVRAILPTELVPKGGSRTVKAGMRGFDSTGENVVVTTDHSVAVWNWSKSTADAPRAPVVLPVSASLADVMGAEFRPDNRIVFATRSGGVFEWDWTRGPSVEAVRLLVQADRNPQLSPGGAFVAVVDPGHLDTVVITATAGGKATRLTVGKPVTSVGFSPDNTLVGTNSSGHVEVWSVPSGARVTSFALGESDGGQLGFTADDRRLAIGSAGSIKVIELDKPADVATLKIDVPAGLQAHCCDVNVPTALVWSPDGRALAVATSDDTVRVWVGGATTPTYLNGYTSTAGGVAFSPDGRRLLSASSHAEVWDWAAADPLSYPGKSYTPPVFSPDGGTVAVADGDANALIVGAQSWSTRRLARGIPLAFSPDGRRLVLEEPGAVTVWDIESAMPVGRLPVSNPDFDMTPGWVYPRFVARFDPSGSILAVLDKTERPAKLLRWQWNSATPAQEASGSFGHDGVQVLVGWSEGAIHYIVREHLESWDGNNAARVLAAVPTQTGDIDEANYLSPTKMLLTFGNQTRLWDLSAKTVTDVLARERYGSSQFTLSGDRALLAVSGDDGYVNMWDMRPSDPPIRIGRYSVAPHIALNGDGSRLAIADTSSVMVVAAGFAGPFPAVLDMARRLVVRHLTADEEAQYLSH